MSAYRDAIFFFLSAFCFPSLYAQEHSDYSKSIQNLEQQAYIGWLFAHSEVETTLAVSSETILRDTLWITNPNHPLESTLLDTSNLQTTFFYELYKKHPNTEVLLGLLSLYHTELAPIFTEMKLPGALLMLPAVGSGFNPESVNTLYGIGYWHLNYPQALKYGLTVNAQLDERRNLKKSTRAALAYIAHLYRKYGSWELALAAYACGPVTLNNLLQRQRVSSYSEVYTYLPEATRDLLPAMAGLYQLYLEEEVPGNKKILPNLKTDTIYISKSIQFQALQDVLGGNREELKFLNPEILIQSFPDQYTAKVSKELKSKFQSLRDSLYSYQDSTLLKLKTNSEEQLPDVGMAPTVYRVTSGDVLGTIAERYGVRVRELQDWNNLRSTRIDIGQELIIYSSSSPAAKAKTTSVSKSVEKSVSKPVTNSKSDYITYTVKSGDNLWIIARKFPGVSAQNIMDLNGIDENLQVGQVLKIKIKQ